MGGPAASNNPGTGELNVPPGERDSLLSRVEQCDKDVERARLSFHNHELLAQLETGLHLRRKLYQEGHPEVSAACRRLCESYNCVATIQLQHDKLKEAHELLKRAEEVADRSDVDRAITWNNMACYYRRMNKLRTAVTLLERALAIEEHRGNSDAAQTHLNLCATLSQLNRHSDAKQHAQSAVIRVYEMVAPMLFNGSISTEDLSDEARDQLTVLCIAYHNLAVEHEHLKNLEAAASAYAEGVKWSTKFLGESSQLAGILQQGLEVVTAKLPQTSGVLRRANEDGWSTTQKGRSSNAARPLDGLMTSLEPASSDSPETDTF